MGSVTAHVAITAQTHCPFSAPPKHIEKLKNAYAENPRLFSDLIREKLLNNPHRLTLIVHARPRNPGQEKTPQFTEKMTELKTSLSQDELETNLANARRN